MAAQVRRSPARPIPVAAVITAATGTGAAAQAQPADASKAGSTWCLEYPVVHFRWVPGASRGGHYRTEWHVLFRI